MIVQAACNDCTGCLFCYALNRIEESYQTGEKIIGSTVYTEHNDGYLAECLENLRSKAIEIQG